MVQMFFPKTAGEVLDLLEQSTGRAQLIAGGSALVPWLHQGSVATTTLISLRDVTELDRIWIDGDRLSIGAMVTMRHLETAAAVRRYAPLLADAAHTVGHLRIRNQATLGGNLMEANYGTDMPAALAVLDAVAVLRSPRGVRRLAIDALLLEAGQTALQYGEIVTHVELPLRPQSHQIYLKFRGRAEKERPCVGVAALVEFEQAGQVASCQIAVGAATTVPVRLPHVEARVRGRSLDTATIREVAMAYAEGMRPISDLRGSAWFRRTIIAVLIKRALSHIAHTSPSSGE